MPHWNTEAILITWQQTSSKACVCTCLCHYCIVITYLERWLCLCITHCYVSELLHDPCLTLTLAKLYFFFYFEILQNDVLVCTVNKSFYLDVKNIQNTPNIYIYKTNLQRYYGIKHKIENLTHFFVKLGCFSTNFYISLI